MSHVPDTAMAAAGKARRAARAWAADLDIEAQRQPFRPLEWSEDGPHHPALQLDDVSAIPFLVDVAGVEEYQHRGRLRAGDGDVYATVTPAAVGYEDYCQQTLRLGAPEHLVADPIGPPIAVARACREGRTYRRLVEVAKSARGFAIHPYMGIEDVWALGEKLRRDAGVPVQVLAPPPPVTWVANDKAMFDELVMEVLGREALVATHIATTADEIAAHLQALTRSYERVALKRTRCASAMGNAVFLATSVSSTTEARRAVDAFLERTEWPAGEPVLAVAWHETDLSPSTQLWIPPKDRGQPRLDGIYEQILAGEEKVFVGSRPSTLPAAVNEALGASAWLIAVALQELGYVGRCSFDHLVEGDPLGEFRVLFTECNGRWGGTSMPMSLVDRLNGEPRPAYRAQDVVFSNLVGAGFADILQAVGDLAFDADSRRGRFIFYNLGPLEQHGKFDVISIGTDPADAERGILEILPERLGA